ncbi:hypothetical protein RV00_GL000894 [Enterococcus devriesei]|uniref:Uncharacterized protein n=1 Tax=Enterococcus devriesei TaxID=319970 RepID=A0A1L8SQH6_9ENTE|nr:hypothetical protein RV00_GL000894 [Enterococcus devriesei]
MRKDFLFVILYDNYGLSRRLMFQVLRKKFLFKKLKPE